MLQNNNVDWLLITIDHLSSTWRCSMYLTLILYILYLNTWNILLILDFWRRCWWTELSHNATVNVDSWLESSGDAAVWIKPQNSKKSSVLKLAVAFLSSTDTSAHILWIIFSYHNHRHNPPPHTHTHITVCNYININNWWIQSGAKQRICLHFFTSPAEYNKNIFVTDMSSFTLHWIIFYSVGLIISWQFTSNPFTSVCTSAVVSVCRLLAGRVTEG